MMTTKKIGFHMGSGAVLELSLGCFSKNSMVRSGCDGCLSKAER
jgi:hypothetical protein